jgi:hypothetical protein
MVNEYASSEVFEALASQLAFAGFDESDVATARAFAEEERTHGVLCGSVVEAAGGEALAPWPRVAKYPLRNLLSVSCLSETVAVALLSAERLSMPEGALRELLTSIVADEMGHARFGWRLVTSRVPRLDEASRERLTDYLRVAFTALEAHELAHLPTEFSPPPEGRALGLCRGDEARRLFYETVDEAIVPPLEALGLRAAEAWRSRERPRSPQSYP